MNGRIIFIRNMRDAIRNNISAGWHPQKDSLSMLFKNELVSVCKKILRAIPLFLLYLLLDFTV
jgi:hypothetical protein